LAKIKIKKDEAETLNSESIREQALNIEYRTPNDQGRGQRPAATVFPLS
jgi:hypothetical protein